MALKKLLYLLLIVTALTGCQQDIAVTPQLQKVVPVNLLLDKDGTQLLRFGTSFKDSIAILDSNKLQYTSEEKFLKIRFKNVSFNNIPVHSVVLSYTTSNLLYKISIYGNRSSWDESLKSINTLNNQITRLYGKPDENHKFVKRDINSLEVRKKGGEHKSCSWINKQLFILTKIEMDYERGYDVVDPLDGYEVWVSITMREGFKDFEKNLKVDISNAGNTLTKKGQRIKSKHSGWDNDTCNAVGDGSVNVGMSKEQVRASWGRPESINTTTTVQGSREQWVYGIKNYVYFDGNTCTTIQN